MSVATMTQAAMQIDRERDLEEAEAIERESQGWVDPERFNAALVRSAIEIVAREADVTLGEMAALIGVGRTTLYGWMARKRRIDRLTQAGLWVRLADIRAEYGWRRPRTDANYRSGV